MTQHNAALVEETNAAIERTEAPASELDMIVDRFVVNQAACNRSQGCTSHQSGRRPAEG